MFQRNRRACAVVLCCLASSVWAQATNPDEYSKNIAHHSAVSTLTDTFAGDHIELSSGKLEIIQTDVDLPGNNALPVRVGRRFEVADVYSGGHFGLWTLDIPNVHGTFSEYGWVAEDSSTNRCSSYSAPPIVNAGDAWWDPNEYWHGTFFYLPGSGDSELLQFIGNQHAPNDGGAYHAMTKEGAVARCVTLSATSAGGIQGGEGFEIVTRNGVVYTLNQMAVRYRGHLKKSTTHMAQGLVSAGSSTKETKNQSVVIQPQASVGYILGRDDYFLFPTKVTDRFGNTVTYNWSTNNPWQLLSILGSDGRRLDFTYVAADSEKVATVSDGTRTWQYAYSIAMGTDYADTVTLPDNTMWTYRLGTLHSMSLAPNGSSCSSMDGTIARTAYADASNTPTRSGSITGPSGATVTFNLGRVLLGRSHLVFNCVVYNDAGDARPNNPYLFLTPAVISKTITGPGLPANGLNWRYAYGPTNNCWDGVSDPNYGVVCTGGSPTMRSVVTTGPDGVKTRYTFGNQANVDEGLLYKTEYGWDGSQAKRVVQIDYADPNSAPYESYSGWSPRGYGDFELTSKVRPQRKITTTQQGQAFTWAVASDCSGMPYCFDSYARPTKVVKSSVPSP